MSTAQRRLMRRGARTAALAVPVTASGVLTAAPSLAAANQRVDLRVLVVTDGNGPVRAIEAELAAGGVPYTLGAATA